ncbi:TolC family outer membrane protein [Pseudooceanicola aestuarii]|uniref:TolC family outer membrane protein n=1 Tax=Pseudooceanicola aestuarii TaxID=2697319 RepID=UPI0013D34B9D|nr:TolC family outer membrane protein [Pseudooceanicola aestuarii]
MTAKTRGLKHFIRGATAVAFLGLGIAAPRVATAETLADALASSYRHSGLLEQNQALLRVADEDVAQALSALRPILTWSAGVSRDFGTSRSALVGVSATSSNAASVGLSLDWLLYDFGASRLNVDIAKETVLASRAQLLALEQQVLLRGVAAYLEVRRAGQFLELRQSNLRLIRQELRAAQDRFEVGEVTRTDVSLTEARLAAAQSGVAQAQGDLMRAQVEYLAAVGHKPGTLAPATLPANLPATADAAAAVALRVHPQMDAARRQVTIADLAVAVADASLKPQISLSSSLSLTESLGSDTYSRGGSITIGAGGPVYAGGRLASVQRQALQRVESARAQLHVTSHDIRQGASNAVVGLQVSESSIVSSREQVRAAELAFRGVRDEAALGARTTLDVLNAEQELLNARTNLISAQVDEKFARYQLLSAMGQLTAQKMKLGVQIYDPAAYYNLVKDAPAGVSEQGKRLDSVLRRLGKE